jgi:hypothetical protein
MVGPAFMLNAVGGLVIALLLVLWRHWGPLLLGAGFGIATLGAFVIAATHGLYGVHEHWQGGPVWTAAIAEVVAILASVAAAVHERYLPTSRPASRERQVAHLH